MKTKEITKTWTWAALYYFSNPFNTYGVGENFTISRDLIHTPKRGDIIRIQEFDFEKFKNRADKSLKSDSFLTGREMVVKCIDKIPNTVSEQWGMPMVTSFGPATFKILSKTVSDSFDPKSLYQ